MYLNKEQSNKKEELIHTTEFGGGLEREIIEVFWATSWVVRGVMLELCSGETIISSMQIRISISKKIK